MHAEGSVCLRLSGVGFSSPTEKPATLPDLGRDKKLASVEAQRAMVKGCMVLWGLVCDEA
jgi:hypothetical protein